MKTILTLSILLVTCIMAQAQSWSYVGTPGFSTGVALSPSIDFDRTTNTPYVAYRDNSNGGKASVMKYDGTTWNFVGTAGFTDSAATNTVIKVHNGTPYLLYVDEAYSNKTTLVKFNNGTWDTVGAPGFSTGGASFASMDIDSSGNIYVAYRDLSEAYKGTVMKYDGTSWAVVGTAGFTSTYALYTDIHYNDGKIYMAYKNGTGGAARLAVYDTAWSHVGGNISTGEASYTTLAFKNDTPYVAYMNVATSNKAQVKRFDGTTWNYVGSTNVSFNQASHLTLKIDEQNDKIYLCFRDALGGYKATVMVYNGVSWTYLGLSYATPVIALKPALALNNYGEPYVTYQDGGSGDKCSVRKFGPLVSSVSTFTEDEDISVYPNPTSDVVFIENQGGRKLTVSAYNNLGKVIKTMECFDSQTAINLSEYSNGVYYLIIQNGSKNSMHKIIKQ